MKISKMRGFYIVIIFLVAILFGALFLYTKYFPTYKQNLPNDNSGEVLPKDVKSSPIESPNEVLLKENKILSKEFELLSIEQKITFGEALENAKYVEKLTGVRPAFLMSILQEELALEKTDMCYLTDIKTGEGIRAVGNEKRIKTMHPTRDLPAFLDITKTLGKDPLKTLVTCPMSFGWGGAMGPADFIPSTWILYKDKIESITKKVADPWDIKDAFLACGLYLSDSGAKSRTKQGEWDAAMIYFSGSATSPYTFYAKGALELAGKIQSDIDALGDN